VGGPGRVGRPERGDPRPLADWLLANFDAHCAAYGGEALPNRWHSARDLDNIEGDLVGHADNLRFLMGRLDGTP